MTAERQGPEGAEEPPVDATQKDVMYARIPEGMTHQILRNGFIPDKKSTDSSYTTGIRASTSYRGE